MTISWTISDGTEVTFDKAPKVIGSSPFAAKLRYGLSSATNGMAPSVDILPPPSGSVSLDPSNAWLVDFWLRGLALLNGLTISSEYDAPIDDAPPYVRDMLAGDWPS
jgi:hypothetical protein